MASETHADGAISSELQTAESRRYLNTGLKQGQQMRSSWEAKWPSSRLLLPATASCVTWAAQLNDRPQRNAPVLRTGMTGELTALSASP